MASPTPLSHGEAAGSSLGNVRPAVTSWTIATMKHTPKNATATHPAHPRSSRSDANHDEARTSEDEPESSNLLALNSASVPRRHYPRRAAPYARGRGAEPRNAATDLSSARSPSGPPSVRSASQSTGSSTNVRIVGFPRTRRRGRSRGQEDVEQLGTGRGPRASRHSRRRRSS
jgi:hypothetical protein